MAFTKEALKAGHSPEARKKAVETMRKNGTGIFRKGGIKRTHRTPAQRSAILAKIDAARAKGTALEKACKEAGIFPSMYAKWKANPSLLAKKGGTTSLIDVASLPTRPTRRKSIARKGTRLLRTPLVKAQLVVKTDTLIASGKTIKEATKMLGIFDGQYRKWRKEKDVKAAMNGYAHHPAPNGHAVRLVLQLNGEDHNVSLQEAMSLREGLDALLGARTAVD